MKRTRTYLALLTLAVAVLVASGCGGSSDSGTSAPKGSSGTETVSVRSVDGVGDVLVDAQGAALYAADQETSGMVACTDTCTSIWDPLTVSAGMPTAGDGVTAVGAVTRPDGTRQVTVDGRLLYRFTEDPGTGVVTGNGFADSFDGKAFTWHVATPTGISTTSENSTASGDSAGSLYR